MLTQPSLPLARPLRARLRSVRRPFHPSGGLGPYRLPHDARDRLAAALAPFRNREAAFALAVFIARFWSMPGRIIEGFYIDRRALAGRPDLGLTERQVRSAIHALEEIGFLDRAIPPSGSKYKATEEGLHRKPIRFGFGSEYAHAFIAANERAARARGRHSGERRPLTPTASQSPSTASPATQTPKCPKSQSVANPQVYLGQLKAKKPIGITPQASEANPRLEAALDRLLQGIRQSRRV